MEETIKKIDPSIDKNKINQENISLNVNSTEEKSTFERAIIEAFKQENSFDCIKKLTIAYDEIKFFIKDILNSNGKKFILNRNLLDKLNRLDERKFFNVNILIGKIFNDLLETSNFEILSNDVNLIIQFSNQILNNLDIIQSTNISLSLEKKCSTFLNFLLQNTKLNLDEEQKETLKELLNNFPLRFSSDSYKNFKDGKDNIINNCQSDNLENKIEGINILIDYFNNTFSIEEQFDLLLQYSTQIIKSFFNNPNKNYRKAYFKLGNFITSMLYSIKFKVKIEEENNMNNMNSKSIFLYDNTIENEKEINNIHLEKSESNYSMNDLNFLNNSLFELTNQKEILIQSENIISICLIILNSLIIYNEFFYLQYVCYLLLKKIYFIFPQYRKNIEDLIIQNLINLSIYEKKEDRLNTIECRQFLNYLLNNGEEELKKKLNEIIEEKNYSKNIELEENIKFDQISVEYENLNFSDFNLRIGYPNLCSIEAGDEFSKFIEIENNNSLIYIGIATNEYDINVKLFKYYPYIKNNNNNNDNDNYNLNDYFVEIYKLERFDCSEIPLKIILFCKEAGIYKLVFDNSYSWFTSKIVRYRLSILKLISDIKQDKIIDNQNSDKIEVDVQI